MKFLKQSFTVFLLGLFVIGLTDYSTAQDRRSVIETYNKALETANAGDYEQAISLYNQAIAQAEELGEEGQDIVTRAEDKLPQIYYQLGLEHYRTFQQDKTLENIDATIEAFLQTQEIGEELGDQQIASKAENVVTQLMYSKSLVQYQQQDFDAALTTLDDVIERNANYAKAYYQKGLVLKNMDEVEGLERGLEWFDKAIEIGQQTGDNDIVTNAQEAARDQLIYNGAQATRNNDATRAIELLKRALKYDSTSADAHYRLAEAYNKTQQWQQAVEHANQGLEYESGGRTDRAKIYFELATAYQGMGQKENACSAYSNAAFGSFKSPAEHQMEYELKCDTTTN